MSDLDQNQAVPSPPEGFERIYEGQPLAPFYAAEMMRPYIGRYLWVRDGGNRVRSGELTKVPNIRDEEAREAPAPVEFADEKPLYLRGITCIAVYRPRR
jgi:hypothetical protein